MNTHTKRTKSINWPKRNRVQERWKQKLRGQSNTIESIITTSIQEWKMREQRQEAKNTKHGEQTWTPELAKGRRRRAIKHERKLDSIISNNIGDKRRREKRCLKKNEYINKPRDRRPWISTWHNTCMSMKTWITLWNEYLASLVSWGFSVRGAAARWQPLENISGARH